MLAFRLRLGLAVLSFSLVALLLICEKGFGQSTPEELTSVLDEEILSPGEALFQIKSYILSRVAPPPAAINAQQWTKQAQRLREHVLRDIVFHGWPRDWVDAPSKFEDLGLVETHQGYRLRKLRYEIVPGFQSVAILYEPEKIQGKAPAILNLNGHAGPLGKAVEYKQKRCINFAKHGILALNMEWFSFGELAVEGNQHWYAAHLDLVGANGLGIFLLEMRRGLDYLYDHPSVDRKRIGVTGLSGGGWQTIFLSSLDDRVRVAVPVAGFSSLATKVEARKYGDLGDIEQNGTDLLSGLDYTHLTALMAPRPTLLIYNAEDDCCFRAPLVKPLIYDGVRGFFKLYGKEDAFQWYENRDPGTHNYQLLNREQAYRFFSRQFGLPPIEREIPTGQEMQGYDALVVGLPKENLTILDLARKLASGITRTPIPPDSAARAAWADWERRKLSSVVRYKPAQLSRVWTVANTKNRGVETLSYLFEMNNGLSASGVWAKGIAAGDASPVTIVLNDGGRKAAASDMAEHVNRDEQALALDLTFFGDAWKDLEPYSYAQLIDAEGERPLGIHAGQLIEVAQWLRKHTGTKSMHLESRGIRTEAIALVVAALQPELFSQLVVHDAIPSLNFVLQAPINFQQAPELFCLDFYKDFDFDRLAAIAAPAEVKWEGSLKPAQH